MNNAYREHDITLASFAQIDREIAQGSDAGHCFGDGAGCFSEAEYDIVRRVIHTTADFDFIQLMRFSHQPVEAAIAAFTQQMPIITDVSMVAAGIRTVVNRTWRSPIKIAVQHADSAVCVPEQRPNEQRPNERKSNVRSAISDGALTRSATGMQQCARENPGAVVAVGNAPTALLTLCEGIRLEHFNPALVIGAPVGFINVIESKQALAALNVPHILVTGRKGGSAVAAAILNALMIWAWNQSVDESSP